MKTNKWILGLMLLCAAASGAAWADGRGHRYYRDSRVGVGVYFGVPLGYHWYGPPSYYYYPYPQTVIVRPEPVYIERAAPQAAPAEAVWYYCSASRTYYPYVKECPGGWERIVPTPPPN